MKTYINANALRACAITMAKSDVRYYLNGLCVEQKEGNTNTLIIATDGHRLTATRTDLVDESREIAFASETRQTIIPRETVEAALKLAGRKTEWLEFDPAGNLGGINFTPIDARFPDWRLVVPESTSGEIAQYNPQYILDAHKSIAAFEGLTMKATMGKIVTSYNGSSSAIVTNGNPDIVHVVMPVRADKPAYWRPSWAN